MPLVHRHCELLNRKITLMLGFPVIPRATFSTGAAGERGGRGGQERSRGLTVATPANGVVTQLQLFKSIDLPCIAADIHWPQSSLPHRMARWNHHVSFPLFITQGYSRPSSPCCFLSPLLLHFCLCAVIWFRAQRMLQLDLSTSQCLVVVCCKMLLLSQLSHGL